MLTEREAVVFLRENGYLTGAQVFEHGARLVSRSGRHVNYAVVPGDGPAFLVKQGTGEDGFGTVRHEAAVLANFDRAGFPGCVRRAIPRPVAYHERDDVLVLDFVRGAQDLRERLRGRRAVPGMAARRLGRVLGLLHASTRDEQRQGAPHKPPWVLALHRPRIGLLREASAGNQRLIGVLQDHPDVLEELGNLARTWRRISLVHFDVRLENLLLVAPHSGSGGAAQLKLVDWEFAGCGDPCWDVGSVFAELLCLWLQSIPLTNASSAEPRAELATRPLATLRPAIETFWNAYLRVGERDAGQAADHLLGCVRWAAARMMQTAYEMTQNAVRPTAHAGFIVQVAANLMARPEEAAHGLLGLRAG